MHSGIDCHELIASDVNGAMTRRIRGAERMLGSGQP